MCRNMNRIIAQTETAYWKELKSMDSFVLKTLQQHYHGCDRFNLYLEGLNISPFSFQLNLVYKICRNSRFLMISNQDIDSYITFTRFGSGLDKAFCDWCSIANGMLELIIDKHLELIRSDDWNVERYVQEFKLPCELKTFRNNVRSIHNGVVQKHRDQLAVRTEQIQPYIDELDNRHMSQKIKNKICSKLCSILELRNMIEIIERRWCPFRHLREINFDRNYYVYSANNTEDLKQVQEILIQSGIVDCKDCAKTINSSLQSDHSMKLDHSSIFDSYIEEIRNLF